MKIIYDHGTNLHTLPGPLEALTVAFRDGAPKNLLDVGCGIGTWLKAANELGVTDFFGIDGIINDESLYVPRNVIDRIDLSVPFNLGRRFDMALCIEVAEHLPEASAADLVSSIVAHTDTVLFGAACPGQPGQHHINCQWPIYWQEHFNRHGFICDDSIRWQIWGNSKIEVWYRQNIFWARLDPSKAGREPRLRPVIHPEFIDDMCSSRVASVIKQVEDGNWPLKWYVSVWMRSAFSKLSRRVALWRK